MWRKRTGANDALNNISIDHEYIICYAKQSAALKLNGLKKDFANYSNPDNDPRGPWAKDNLTCNKTASQSPTLHYPITDPETGITYECNPNRVWAHSRARMERLILEKKVIFPRDGQGTPMYKRHLSEVRSDYKPFSSLIETEMNFMATKRLRDLFGIQLFDHLKGSFY